MPLAAFPAAVARAWQLAVMPFLSAVFLIGCATGAVAPSADTQQAYRAISNSDKLIVGGERVGPVRLGMGLDEVKRLLGNPESSRINVEGYGLPTSFRYPSVNMEVDFSFSATPIVEYIRVSAYAGRSFTFGEAEWSLFTVPRIAYRTVDGIELGSSSFDVARRYGAYTGQGPLMMIYRAEGLTFSVTGDQRIWRLGVSRKGLRD